MFPQVLFSQQERTLVRFPTNHRNWRHVSQKYHCETKGVIWQKLIRCHKQTEMNLQ